MHADFGNRLDHLSDEMCQMNTRIDRIARRQSRLDCFTPSPSLKHAKDSSSLDGGDDDDDDDDDASGSETDDEMTAS